LSFDLRFKGLRFPIVSIILIGVFDARSNPKPLNPYPKADNIAKLQLVLGQKYLPLLLWVLLE
jgi:hypothetical protein